MKVHFGITKLVFFCALMVAIVPAEECKNDRDWYYEADVPEGANPKRGCNAIAKNPAARCNSESRQSPDGVLPSVGCPLTCGTCNGGGAAAAETASASGDEGGVRVSKASQATVPDSGVVTSTEFGGVVLVALMSAMAVFVF